MLDYILLLAGLAILIKGADLLVSSSSRIAKAWKVPAFLIGLVVVALGTSAPEAAIGVSSALQGANSLSFGDVVGSNIVNFTLILGLSAMAFPLDIRSSVMRMELALLILIELVFTVFALAGGGLSWVDGLVLVLGMGLFTVYLAVKSKGILSREKPEDAFDREVIQYLKDEDAIAEAVADRTEAQDLPPLPSGKSGLIRLWGVFAAGLSGLIGGAHLSVYYGVAIAREFGLSETLIGLTIIAVGTSLPELVACLMALKKKEQDLAVGNIVGSNILNILFVLGLSVLIHPIPVSMDSFPDLLFMIASSAGLFLTAMMFGKVSRFMGVMLILEYLGYLALTTFMI